MNLKNFFTSPKLFFADIVCNLVEYSKRYQCYQGVDDIADDVVICHDNGHTITDATDRTKILNKPCVDCHIGDQCWIDTDVIVSKDADIPNDCIVERRSFANNTLFESHYIIAGYRAKIVKRNVDWSHSPIYNCYP